MKRLLLIIAILLISLILTLAYAWQKTGLSVSGLRWYNDTDYSGLQIGQWSWTNPDGCTQLSGQNASIAFALPLSIHTQKAQLHDCASEPMAELPALNLPALPEFELHVDELDLNALPTLRLHVTQREQLWQIKAAADALIVNAELSQPTGDWTLQADAAAHHINPDLQGQLVVNGQGIWLGNKASGQLNWKGRQLGHQSQPQRAELTGTLHLDDTQWIINAELTDTLALTPEWQISSIKPVRLQGQLFALEQMDAELLISNADNHAKVTLNSQGLNQGKGQVQLGGQLANGELAFSWLDQQLQLQPTKLLLAGQYQLTLPSVVTIPMLLTGQADIPWRLHVDQLSLSSDHSQLQWQGTDWQWQSRVDARGQVANLPINAQASVQLREQGQRLNILPGTSAKSAGGLIQQYLVRPFTVSTRDTVTLTLTPVLQVNGQLHFNAEGIASSQLNVPPVQGQIVADDQQLKLTANIAQWQSDVSATALLNDLIQSPRKGHFNVNSRLPTQLSRDLRLGLNLQAGNLTGQGQWHWDDIIRSESTITLAGVNLDMGNIGVRGLNATALVNTLDAAIQLRSHQAITIQQANIGIPITDISFHLQGQPAQWQLAQLQAKLLGGKARLEAIGWPNSDEQTLMLEWLDLKQVSALQNNPNPDVSLSGHVSGSFPLTLRDGKLSIRDGRLDNQQPLHLKLNPSASFKAMGGSNMAVQFALDTLSELDISVFNAGLDMAEDGWIDVSAKIDGVNPRKGSQPIVLNYSHKENILDLLRSLRIGDEVSERILKDQVR